MPPQHTNEKIYSGLSISLGKAIWRAIIINMKYLVILPCRPYSSVWQNVFPNNVPVFNISALREYLFGFEKMLRLDSYATRHPIDISLLV